MNRKVAVLGRIATARKRLRDAASAAAAQAESLRLAAEAEESRVHEDIETLLATATARFATMASANDLLAFHFDREHALTALQLAAEETQRARTAADQRRAELAAKARELKTSEVALDRTLAGIAVAEKKHEQELADDLSGSRTWRTRG